MKHVTFKKGQGIVEFALVLAFVTIIGLFARDGGLGDVVGLALKPTADELARLDINRTYDVKATIFGSENTSGLKTIQLHYKDEGNADNKRNYLRGMLRSDWVKAKEEDAANQYVQDLSNELGASQWSYINGEGNNFYGTIPADFNGDLNSLYEIDKNKQNSKQGIWIGDKGLYWTVETLNMSSFHYYSETTTNSSNTRLHYSKEQVLQYFYSELTGKYYVIKNYVWINQKDTNNLVALGALHSQWNRPEGSIIADENGKFEFDTLEEAKELFEKERMKETEYDESGNVLHESGSVIFRSAENNNS